LLDSLLQEIKIIYGEMVGFDKNAITGGESKGFSYSPMARGHRPTFSQESNTLSEVSCATDVSEVCDQSDAEVLSDSDEDSGHNVNSQQESESGDLTENTVINMNSDSKVGEKSEPSPIIIEVDSVILEIPTAQQNQSEKESRNIIPGEPLKTLLSLVFLFGGFMSTSISLALTHERVPDIAPLPDILLDNVPYQHWGLDVSEILLMVSTSTAVLVVMLHSHRLIILRRVWLVLGLLYYYRAVTMFVTALPKVDHTYVCSPKVENITAKVVFSRVLTIMSGGGLSINGKHIYCGDYIFSGHTMTLTLGYLVIRQYSPSRFILLHWVSLLTSLLGVVFLLLGRGHYTVDVLLAYFVTTRVWWLYHTFAHNQVLKDSGEHNSISNVCWWHAFRYLDEDIAAVIVTYV
jgi:shingomyelin synthase